MCVSYLCVALTDKVLNLMCYIYSSCCTFGDIVKWHVPHVMKWNQVIFCLLRRIAVPTVDVLLLGNFEVQCFGKGDAWILLLGRLCSCDCLGANVNRGRGLDSPLHAVARGSNVELAYLLMDFGANPQARNADGKRPSELVTSNSPLVKFFLEHEGTSPLPKPKP